MSYTHSLFKSKIALSITRIFELFDQGGEGLLKTGEFLKLDLMYVSQWKVISLEEPGGGGIWLGHAIFSIGPHV